MESIRESLERRYKLLKKVPVKKQTRRKGGNRMYGVACDLQRKLGLGLPMCFRLLKKHTPGELGRLVSWWKDYPYKKDNNIGLLYWKLKQLYPEKYAKK